MFVPTSVVPSQSSSTLFPHASCWPGWTVGSASLQSFLPCGHTNGSPTTCSAMSHQPSPSSSQPSSVLPSQLSSRLLHSSTAPGWTPLSLSSQSPPCETPPPAGGAHVHVPAPVPYWSPSASVKYVVQPLVPGPSVSPLQSLSTPSHTSAAGVAALHGVKPAGVHLRTPPHVPASFCTLQVVLAPSRMALGEHPHSPLVRTHCLPAPCVPLAS